MILLHRMLALCEQSSLIPVEAAMRLCTKWHSYWRRHVSSLVPELRKEAVDHMHG